MPTNNGLFLAQEFTATKFRTADEKAKFANHFFRFVSSSFAETLFTQAFYERLSNTFGHIAHNSKAGFYDEFFRNAKDQLRFLDQVVKWPCYGDPAWTFSDVERAIQDEVARQHLVERQELCVDEEMRQVDMTISHHARPKRGAQATRLPLAAPAPAATRPSVQSELW
ncbi:MAG TPA: hypothetical protein VMU57_20910 [Edaphobacter sp.]|uniref:hypothetical protein n=1 Tax=Edaphobacter sp. TaxID=1934404 RepID=UPI002C0A31A4|nr:hypothetical protein [Edaphobacter sp.]HUZ97372.1 hypothetical protein [Edaphobacter sp.]